MDSNKVDQVKEPLLEVESFEEPKKEDERENETWNPKLPPTSPYNSLTAV